MIRPLRQRHRAVWSLLAIALPLLFLAALTARPKALPAVDLPEGLERAWGAPRPLGPSATRDAWQEAQGWRARRVRSSRLTGALAEEPGEGGAGAEAWVGVEVELRDLAPAPDLLVYWIEGEEGVQGEVAQALTSAWLLGAAPLKASRLYALPRRGAAGTLVLYSLAHRSAYGALLLPAGGD